ncbi:MAG: MFS transporter [Gemmatimonadales bacterium]|nr:MFS transporter [Gemmatimonadales bacterium]
MPLRAAAATILVAGLGYFVDVFDLLLFAVVRVASVQELGAGPRALEVGALLQNAQLVGMMLGGFAWGVLGDRRGRRSVLYGSILCYSLANLANAAVTSVPAYVACRLVAGFGLAGELGAALTIVGELVETRARGAATAIVAAMGVLGAVAAALVGEQVPWRTAYVVGGAMGLALLLLRVGVRDSAMFARARAAAGRGDVRRLFDDRDRAARFLRAIAIGMPVWFAVGILITFAPEFARALGVAGEVTAARAVLLFYAGTTLGDLASGPLSQALCSRKRAVGAFLWLCLGGIVTYLAGVPRTAAALYATCAVIGFGVGYWAVLVTMAVELFGTDLRATVATSVPNLVRVTAVPMTLAFLALRAPLGLVGAAALVGAVAMGAAAWALRAQPETYGRELDFLEGHGRAA